MPALQENRRVVGAGVALVWLAACIPEAARCLGSGLGLGAGAG